MLVNIKMLTGGIIYIEADSNETVLSLKHKIAQNHGIEIAQQFLILNGHLMEDNVPLAVYELEKENAIRLIVQKQISEKQAIQASPSYLMFDHGGVLDGQIIMNDSSITNNDIVLESYDWGGKQILKNGVQIIHDLDTLVREHDYKIIFHSKNSELDQVEFLEKLERACQRKGLRFPPVYATAVYDPNRYSGVQSNNPVITYTETGILMAGWGSDDLNGKASLRRALEVLLQITPESRANSVVFDDGLPNVTTPRQEGYNAYLIDHSVDGSDLSAAVRNTLILAQNNALNARPVVASQANRAIPVASSFKDLPLDFQSNLSISSRVQRLQLGHISTGEYWGQLSEAQRVELWNAAGSNSSPQVQHSIFAPIVLQPKYEQLTVDQQAFISEKTHEIRSLYGNLPTSEYFNQISKDEQNALLEQCSHRASPIFK